MLIERIRAKLEGERGFIVAVVMAIIGVLAVLAAGLGTLIISEMTAIIQHTNSTRAYYLAETGITHALWEIENWSLSAAPPRDGNVGSEASPISMNVGKNQSGSYYAEYDSETQVLRSYGTVGNVTKRISVKVKLKRYQFVEEFDNKDNREIENYVEWGYDFVSRRGIPGQLTLKFSPGPSYDQMNPDAAVDSQGNIYVVWQDNRHGDWDIYIRKLNPELDPNSLVDLWSQAGLRVNRDPENSGADQKNPRLILDREGNVFVVWQDNREGNWDIYAAKIESESAGRYWDFKVNSDSSTKDQENPDIGFSSPEESPSYVYVVWEDSRNTTGNRDIYAQKLDLDSDMSGNPGLIKQWSGDKLVDQTNRRVRNPVVCGDNTGSVYFAWQQRGSFPWPWDIFARKLDEDGDWVWESKKVSSVSGFGEWPILTINNQRPRIVADDSGNCYFAWERWFREWTADGVIKYPNVYAQKFNSDGERQWEPGWDLQVAWCSKPDIKLIDSYIYIPFQALHGPNRTSEYREYYESYTIYGQKLNPLENEDPLLWPFPNGQLIPATPGGPNGFNQEFPVVVGNSSSNMYYIWQDGRNGDWDIHVRKFNDNFPLWSEDREIGSEGGSYVNNGSAQSIKINTQTTKTVVKYKLDARIFSRGSQVTFSVSADGGTNWEDEETALVKPEGETTFVMGDPDGTYFSAPGNQLKWRAVLDKTNDDPTLAYNEERTPAIDRVVITYWAGATLDYSTWRSN